MNIDKLRITFSEALDIPIESVTDDLQYSVNNKWDSIAHMALIAAIEQAFDILIETDDIIDMGSFAKAQEIIAKYGVCL